MRRPLTSLQVSGGCWCGLEAEEGLLGDSHPDSTFLAYFPLPACLDEISRALMGLRRGKGEWAGLMATPGGYQRKNKHLLWIFSSPSTFLGSK